MAMILALKWILEAQPPRVIILSDCLAGLTALSSWNSSSNSLIVEVLLLLKRTFDLDIHVAFCWIPGHVGLAGNDKADFAAKAALSSSQTLSPATF